MCEKAKKHDLYSRNKAGRGSRSKNNSSIEALKGLKITSINLLRKMCTKWLKNEDLNRINKIKMDIWEIKNKISKLEN